MKSIRHEVSICGSNILPYLLREGIEKYLADAGPLGGGEDAHLNQVLQALKNFDRAEYGTLLIFTRADREVADKQVFYETKTFPASGQTRTSARTRGATKGN